MDRFTAIGVNQGDAFFLERSGKKILVDGGRSRHGFPIQFERVIGEKALDVIVCTHADADHINGLIGFFEVGLRAQEIWLPGSWTSRLKDLLKCPNAFLWEVAKNIDQQNLSNVRNLEDLYERQVYFSQEEKPSDTGDDLTDISDVDTWIEDAQNISFPFIREFIIKHFFIRQRSSSNLLFDAISTAQKIRDLAILAYHSGTKIKWFEYQSSGLIQGGKDFLKPINSREILRIRKRIKALNFLALTVANKESLVFYSPGDDSMGDVLFCADSDLTFLQDLPHISPNSIITSPHHGAEQNSAAYQRLKNEGYLTDRSIIVRSDGKFKKRPGETYKKLKSKKICTLCRHPEAMRQDIVFTLGSKGWRKKNGLSWCRCI